MSSPSKVPLDTARPRAKAIATALVEGAVGRAGVLVAFPAVKADEDGEIAELMGALQEVSGRVSGGDLKDVEAMLVQQAVALDSIFANLAGRASRADTMQRLEAYLRLALKAQSQSRATLEALAEIKNPRPVVVARQANFARQQVVANPGSNVGGAARLEGGDGFFAGAEQAVTRSMVSLSETATFGGAPRGGDARAPAHGKSKTGATN